MVQFMVQFMVQLWCKSTSIFYYPITVFFITLSFNSVLISFKDVSIIIRI